jgi:Putative restriction endonuclease
MPVARALATYEDLFSLPPHHVGEILFGVLHGSPRPAFPHAVAASALGGELSPPFKRGKGGPGGWVILYEPELHLQADILVPDLAGWRRERMPVIPSDAFSTLASDWVAEVLSPSTAALDRGDKLKIYLRERVAHVWLVDPIATTLEILELDGSSYRLIDVFSGIEPVRAVPFDAIAFDIAALWAR